MLRPEPDPDLEVLKLSREALAELNRGDRNVMIFLAVVLVAFVSLLGSLALADAIITKDVCR